MFKKIAAVSCGVFLGILIAFARAGAFPFWSGGSQQDQAKSQSGHAKASQSPPAERAPQTEANGGPAPANQPEPNETGVAIPSFAPLVKRVMGSVVNVSVVQQVKAGFGDQGGPGDSPDAPDSPDGPGAGPGDRDPADPADPATRGDLAARLVSSRIPSISSAVSSARFPINTSSTDSARASSSPPTAIF